MSSQSDNVERETSPVSTVGRADTAMQSRADTAMQRALSMKRPVLRRSSLEKWYAGDHPSDDAHQVTPADEGVGNIQSPMFTNSVIDSVRPRAVTAPDHTRAVTQPDKILNLFGLRYEAKGARKRFRWNIVWQLIVLFGFVPLLKMVGPLCDPMQSILFVVSWATVAFFFVGACNVIHYMFIARSRVTKDWYMSGCEKFGKTEMDKISHAFVLPCYKEPLELICATIETIAAQTIAGQILVCVTLEERSPDIELKKATLQERFGHRFWKLVVTVHPRGLAGEIPGACSNRNWGARRALSAIEEMQSNTSSEGNSMTSNFDPKNIIVTVCDSDTLFHESYAANLSFNFLDSNDRANICFQSPLFYNINLSESYFFTRCTGVIRAFTMIAFLIPFNINTMSIYSIPAELLLKSKFFHPGYQMDDIIFTLSAMQSIGKLVRIKMIEVPTLSGPTSGATCYEEACEWYTQVRRWTIGAGEVFHYFAVKFLGRKFTLCSGFAYGFWLTYYYAYMLCMSGMVEIMDIITRITMAIARTAAPESGWTNEYDMCMRDHWTSKLDYVGNAAFPVVLTGFLFFGVAFVLDCRIVRLLGLTENIGPLRRLFHLVMAKPVLWAYCITEYIAIAQLTIHGKAVCGHAPSQKDNLQTAMSLSSSSGPASLSLEV